MFIVSVLINMIFSIVCKYGNFIYFCFPYSVFYSFFFFFFVFLAGWFPSGAHLVHSLLTFSMRVFNWRMKERFHSVKTVEIWFAINLLLFICNVNDFLYIKQHLAESFSDDGKGISISNCHLRSFPGEFGNISKAETPEFKIQASGKNIEMSLKVRKSVIYQ